MKVDDISNLLIFKLTLNNEEFFIIFITKMEEMRYFIKLNEHN